jgi:pSer/pThr/pTyr-binding forkhead associated (FHA) protein
VAAAYLVLLKGGGAGVAHPILGPATIGRGPGCDISLPDPAVSRAHAAVRLDGATVVVEDLDSANGTCVNSEPIDSARRLEHGDVIGVGATRLEVRIDPDEPEVSTPATPTEIHRR